MNIDVCPSPALYPYYQGSDDIVIVVDIFRATTTICKMFENGALAVIPVAGVEEAKEYKNKNYIVGGERNARKIEFADFGNSPFDYTREVVGGKEIVFTTTNGIQAINETRNSKKLLIGSFSNIDSLIDKCYNLNGRVVILCSGWKNRINLEDTIFAGAFYELSKNRYGIKSMSDSARIALELWRLAKYNPIEYLKESEHYKRLVDNGAEGDIEFCFKKNTTTVVPWYCADTKKMRID